MIGFRCECGAAIDCTYPKCKEGVETNGKDITERLQDYARDYTTTTYHDDLIREAVTEIESMRRQLAGKETEVLHLAGKVLLVEQQLAKRDAEIATMKAEKFESENNQTILMVRISELRQQVTLLRDFATKISKQILEKPDHYTPCYQCEQNSSEAEDIIEALSATEPKEH